MSDIPPPLPPHLEAESSTEVTVDPVTPETDPFNEAREKASGAREVARVLVFTFAATIAAIFLTIALIYVRSSTPAQANEFVKAFVDVVPVMENFVVKVFGPLLAFVLGYYFGEKGRTNLNPS
ncbi:MAG TPA: hypothetical protein VGQ65_24330 [Thermoanaerobaculia bacterium]|jgi:hypothetical protein|nr:hypothetical protein [Thermoanaerobaculia bacterium]